ncbi:Outer capsid protein VP4 [Phytophthora palmivora]|uniref:Outer capsid protein VP4 n=1 Tax=Phytophthora palmivora TaxID=4796 RepID=A0A2P4X8D9_9STRA|nr:Outer capsid protein VP4 [Phytophthora palmivora]
MTWDSDERLFGVTKDNTEVIRAVHGNRLWTFNAHNVGNNTTTKGKQTVKKSVFANFEVTDGVEDVKCPEYIRLMVDRGLAKGIMLRRRGKVDCLIAMLGNSGEKRFRNP